MGNLFVCDESDLFSIVLCVIKENNYSKSLILDNLSIFLKKPTFVCHLVGCIYVTTAAVI